MGLSEAKGSWNTICISRRAWRSLPGPIAITSSPPRMTLPEVGSVRRKSERPVEDLPQPDSPTRLTVSATSTSKDTSSTAWTLATTRRSRPLRTGKRVVRWATCSSRLSEPRLGLIADSGSPGMRIGSGAALPRISPRRGTAARSARV